MFKQVEAVQDALYNCNWMDAAIDTRKLILTYKILLVEPNNIEAPPLFVLNRELITNVGSFIHRLLMYSFGF